MDATARVEGTARRGALRYRVDGRFVLAAALLAYGVALFWPHLGGLTPNWARLGVLDSTWPFADMREVTSAWECVRKGQEVIVHDYCDPIGWRPANFPQIWMRLSFLGLGQSATNALGIGVVLAFLGSIFVVTGPLTLVEGAVWGALVTSPSVMLGVDRANVDLLLFALLVLTLLAFTRGGPRVRWLGCALLELAAWLKLFPIFASGAVLQWRRRRPALLALSALAFVFLGYVLAIWSEVKTIRQEVPTGIDLSFGAGVIVDAFPHYGGREYIVGNRPLAIVLLGALTLAVSVALALLLRRKRREDREADASTRLPWLWAGAGVVVGCWVLTENSFDYRLAFCLLAVPQLMEWTRQANPVMPFARASLLLLVATLWLSDTQPFLWSAVDEPWRRAESVFPFDEILVWCLVVYLTVALLRTLPVWMTRAGAASPAVGAADAADHAADAAWALFEEGNALYRDGEHGGAIARYEEVLELYGSRPNLHELMCGTLLNLGLALEQAGRRPEAAAAFGSIVARFDPDESDYVAKCVRQARKRSRGRKLHRPLKVF